MKRQVNYNFEVAVALVTGAAQGMGLATAKAFARAGASVVLADVSTKGLQLAKEEIAKIGAKVLTVQCDVSDEIQVKALIDETVTTFGRLDAAYNNAGINTVGIPSADVSMADYNRIVSINLNGVWYCCSMSCAG